jgi:hypothetical protein
LGSLGSLFCAASNQSPNRAKGSDASVKSRVVNPFNGKISKRVNFNEQLSRDRGWFSPLWPL